VAEGGVANAQALKHPAAFALLGDRNGSALQRYIDHRLLIRLCQVRSAPNSIGRHCQTQARL